MKNMANLARQLGRRIIRGALLLLPRGSHAVALSVEVSIGSELPAGRQ